MTFKTLLVVIVIALVTVVVYVKVSAMGSLNSNFNQTTRFTLGKYPTLRGLFGLHKPGDARAEYFLGGSPVVVEFVQSDSYGVSDEVVNNFSDKVREYLGKQVSVFNIDKINNDTFTEAGLASIVEDKRRHYLTGQPNLFVIVVNDYKPRAETEISRSFKEFGIVISTKAIRDLTGSNYNAFNDYARSALLHELGLQLGLPLSQNENCIMSQSRGISGKIFNFYGQASPQDFCTEEQQQLKNIKLRLQAN